MTLTIADFYQLPTIFTIPQPIYFLLDNGYLRELSQSIPNYQTMMNIENNKADSKVIIKVHKALQANLNTIMSLNQWQQASVWFNDTPCMIIRNNKPLPSIKQDGYPKHFITDTTAHKAMIYYIISFMKEDPVVDKSIRNQGWNKERLFSDRVVQEPQVLIQPKVDDLQLAALAINLS
jgi:hypothetical protein